MRLLAVAAMAVALTDCGKVPPLVTKIERVPCPPASERPSPPPRDAAGSRERRVSDSVETPVEPAFIRRPLKENEMPASPIRKVKNWNIRFINSQAAWTPLLNGSTPTGFDYGGVFVGHIDTGYLQHDVFGPWDDNGKNDHILSDRGLNLIERDKPPVDPLTGGHRGHGTRIGSVMYGYNPDTMVGVAPRAPVIPYRAVDFTALLHADAVNRVAEAIRHAVENGCLVINLSLGTKPIVPIVSQAIEPDFVKSVEHLGAACDYAYDRGVIVVAALGNNIHDRATKPGKYFRELYR